LHATSEIDLAVQGREQLDGLQPSAIFREPASIADKLVGQVIEGVSQYLQAPACIRGDPAPRRTPGPGSRSLESRHQEQRGWTVSRRNVHFHDRKVSICDVAPVFAN